MTTMSDDGDRTCPLCAEEMDLTDQQLKPCKCGYEICVWCWHHIMEMAEKEGSEGRCPACRTAYDKQRIVGTAANCKRMVAEISADKKQKSQKLKVKPPATVEDRKHLSTVRVVQRNLVYVMGMPSNLADENILERKEYFGQYGKILKVSVSRQVGTTPQQAANSNTFSVYITYAREDEAIRCIQAVHNFILEGKPLRACFGTTKYCYTWLRNMTCSNPDCLYLHDIGSQEDSFTKDEIISAYTRSRVPQILTNNLQPRSGNMLPPPVDDLCSNGVNSTKHSIKSSTNTTTSQVKSSLVNTNGPKATVLPAAASWGVRGSSFHSSMSSLMGSQSPLKQKMEVLNSACSSPVVSGIKRNSAWHDEAVTTPKITEAKAAVRTDGKSRLSEAIKDDTCRDHQIKVSSTSEGSMVVDHYGSAWDDETPTTKVPEAKHMLHVNGRFSDNGSSSTSSVTSSDKPSEVVLEEAHYSAWDDDTYLTSNIPEAKQIVYKKEKIRSSETLEPGSRLAGTSSSDVKLKDCPDAVNASGASTSCSSSQLLPQHKSCDSHIIACTAIVDLVDCTYSQSGTREVSNSHLNELSPDSVLVSSNSESMCLGRSSVDLDTQLSSEPLATGNNRISEGNSGNIELRLHEKCFENGGTEFLTRNPLTNSSIIPDRHIAAKLSDQSLGLQKQILSSGCNVVEDSVTANDDEGHRPSAATQLSSFSSYGNYSYNDSNHMAGSAQNVDISANGGSRIVGGKVNRSHEILFSNGHREEVPSNSIKRGFEFPNISYTEKELYSIGYENVQNVEKNANADKREENIVSKMLSSDFDPWNNSWSSANCFANLLSQMSINQEGSSNLSSTRKPQNTHQSRFSFAWQGNQANLGENGHGDVGASQQAISSTHDLYKSSGGSFFPSNNFDRVNLHGSSGLAIPTDGIAGVARTKVLAPPGFSAPSRAPPPGFSSQDRYDQPFNTSSGTELLGSSFQNQFPVSSTGNTVDVEFIDPAILAVGKGRLPIGVNNSVLGSRSSFHPQFSTSESDARIQHLMQQSISASQDPRIQNHIGDRFLRIDEAYAASRFPNQTPSLSPFAQPSYQQPSQILNSQWNGWSDMQMGNGMGISDVLRHERLGLNNHFPANEEPKYHFPSSGDIYNRAFGL